LPTSGANRSWRNDSKLQRFTSHGAFKSELRSKTLKQLHEFLRICAVLPPDELTARHYGHIKADLEQVGSRIPENDLWIAAIAREHQLPLVTRDQHFSRITGLKILAW
jgi:tRNA(fMet)-specific endonuclease VapC